FRQALWSRGADDELYTQKTAVITIRTADGPLAVSDILAGAEALVATVQREAYRRLLGAARAAFDRGEVVWFDRFGVSRDGVHVSPRGLTSDLSLVSAAVVPWEDVAAVELAGARLIIRPQEGRRAIDVAAAEVPNFPVLLALLERSQPELARDLL